MTGVSRFSFTSVRRRQKSMDGSTQIVTFCPCCHFIGKYLTYCSHQQPLSRSVSRKWGHCQKNIRTTQRDGSQRNNLNEREKWSQQMEQVKQCLLCVLLSVIGYHKQEDGSFLPDDFLLQNFPDKRLGFSTIVILYSGDSSVYSLKLKCNVRLFNHSALPKQSGLEV